jgi:DNA-binding NtrC family response regulator
LLAGCFLERFTAKYNRPGLRLWQNDKDRLLAYAWPGNVRELRNVIERAVLLSTGEDLGLNLPNGRATPPPGLTADSPTLDEMQRRYIQHVIEQTGGKIGGPGGAAEILGMKRTSLINRMNKLGIS